MAQCGPDGERRRSSGHRLREVRDKVQNDDEKGNEERNRPVGEV